MRAGSDVPASERVRQRIVEWIERHGHGAQRVLLTNIKKYCEETRKDQWLSDIRHRRAKIVLDDIDLIAMAMDIQPGELVRLPDKIYLELTMTELEILTAFRKLTSNVQQHIVSILHHIVSRPEKFAKRPHRKVTGTDVSGIQDSSAHRVKGVSSDGLDTSRDDHAFRAELDALIAHTIANLERLQTLRESTTLLLVDQTGTPTPSRPPARGATIDTAPRFKHRK